MNATESKYTNQLIHESSPYLLQHAHNPVNWYPWGTEALDKARNENKILIISIGYAACHWCHVMEHECFEDEEVAGFMNEHFVSIKVDREERPDIDQVYLIAVQILTDKGGWPLNCIALPDGRPVYGGTYFSKERWMDMLHHVYDFVTQNPDKAEEQANFLTDGIRSNEMVYKRTEDSVFLLNDLDDIFSSWKNNIDFTQGGYGYAPKFPMPASLQFLLHFNYLTKHKNALKAVTLTLNKMANGGIYDQIGGGFSRYSTDEYWKVPHFEKMLYDNAQLVSVYSAAYQKTKDPVYKTIVTETLDFIKRELTSPEGSFYSSLDADSEGVEGKFYVWTHDELKKLLGDNAPLIMDYFNVTEKGNWENSRNILFKSGDDKRIAAKYKMTESELEKRVEAAKKLLLNQRSYRIRPALDDKILTSWNALMLKAYADAYRAFDKKEYLDSALKNAQFINAKLKTSDNGLFRNYKQGIASIPAFLDDYAFTIQAFISLYQATFNEKWLEEAMQLAEHVLSHFYEPTKDMFYYSSDESQSLIARKMEIADNVIPSSNSEMAINLFILGWYYYKEEYIKIARRMLNNIKSHAINGEIYYANWDILMAWFAVEPYFVAIVGKNYEAIRKEFDAWYLPQVFFAGGKAEGNLSMLEGKLREGETTIYVCQNNLCKLPVTEVKDALNQISG
ncbi:MAG: thioredoxin domain-containing protein [Bacteroidota bacterium]|nr:thioredoxin domain-containing protein [Bacteroidota bacterium]